MIIRKHIINELFRFVVFIQIITLIIFLLENFGNLSTIVFTIPLEDFNIGKDNTVMVLNFYGIIAIIIVFNLIVIVASLNIINTGLNEVGTKTIARFVYFVSLYAILTITNAYYFLALGFVGLVIEFLISVIYFFKGLQLMADTDGIGEE